MTDVYRVNTDSEGGEVVSVTHRNRRKGVKSYLRLVARFPGGGGGGAYFLLCAVLPRKDGFGHDRISILATLVLNRVRLLYSIQLGMLFKRSCLFIIIDKTRNKRPSQIMLK